VTLLKFAEFRSFCYYFGELGLGAIFGIFGGLILFVVSLFLILQKFANI